MALVLWAALRIARLASLQWVVDNAHFIVVMK
jgi:hypothetical protein